MGVDHRSMLTSAIENRRRKRAVACNVDVKLIVNCQLEWPSGKDFGFTFVPSGLNLFVTL